MFVARFLALFVALVVCNFAFQTSADMYGGPLPPQPRLQPTFRAEEFVESLGLNADPFSRETQYPPETFFDLGVRYYRMCLKYDLTPADAPQLVTAALEKYGARPMMLIDPHKDGSPAELVNLLKRYPPGVIAEVEGPNELNNKFPPQELNMKYKGRIDEAAGAAYMDDYYRAIKADPATHDLPVVAFTAIFTDYRLAKPHTSFDFSNMHSYQGYDVPSGSLEMNFTRFNNILPAGALVKPFVPTECGYNVEEDLTNHNRSTGCRAAQAKNIPMLFAEYFRHGIRRTYLFALHNADGYGLLESGGKNKRPAWFAVKSLVSELRDASWNRQTRRWEGGDFTPKALLFNMPAAAETVHTLVLQKKCGDYFLLLWNELPNYDSASKREIVQRPAPVAIHFQTRLKPQATVVTQNAEGSYDSREVSLENGNLKLAVPSSLMIVRLTPDGIRPGSPLPSPQELHGQASESEAKLDWQPVPGAAGYFVFRNNWHIATTEATHCADRSSWLRPGLGYTYSVQAFDKDGNLSPRTEKVVVTAARMPDLVVSAFGPETETIAAGDQVRFVARVKNVGSGATPPNISVSAAFSIDDKVVGWGGRPGPMPAGAEWTFAAEGGPSPGGRWTATPGGHTLKCVLDDINRLPGEPKGNNMADRSVVVGSVGKGMLLGSSCAAPADVDLTAEGTLDWVHWGLNDKTTITRKAGVNLLSAELKASGQVYLDRTEGCPVNITWRDGSPLLQSRGTHAGLWWNGVGNRRSFSAPADTTTRVLRVYVAGIEGVGATLTAKLSDDSAPPLLSKSWNGNAGNGTWAAVPDGFSAVYTIRYRAGSAGQHLTIAYALTSEPTRFRGQARLQAATLGTR